MSGRRTAVLLLVALGLGGIARADEVTPATEAVDAPSNPTPANPIPMDASPASPTPANPIPENPIPENPTPPDASPAAPAAVPSPEAQQDVPKEPPKEPPKDVAQPPKNLEPIPKDSAITVLGKKVLGPVGEDMGRVTDLLLDRDAQIKSIVIDFGGFLGVGSRKIAIDWRLVRFVPDKPDAPIALSLGKADVQAAPEYKDSAQPPVMVGPPPSGPDAAR